MKAVKKDVFDINKVTVVGSPTITSDGVASGFSTNDYLHIPVQDLSSNNFEVSYKFIYKSSSSAQNIFRCARNTYGGSFGFLVAVSNEGKIYLSGATEEKYYQIPLIDGSQYNSKIVINNTIAKLYLDDVEIMSYNWGKSIATAYISIGNNGWKGSIDLNSFKIYVDGELVYSPTRPITFLERRKEGFDLSKFTVVGSPTITSDGVASGFSSGNYITTENKFSIDISKRFEVYLSLKGIKYNPSLGDTGVIRFNADSNIRFDLRYNGKTFYLVSNGTGNNSESTGIKYFSYDRDMDVKIIFGLNGSTFYCKIKRSYNENWGDLKTTTINIDDAFTNAFIQFGLGWGNYMTSETGSIDLSQFSITVDGKEVFTGAKEKFYAIGDF